MKIILKSRNFWIVTACCALFWIEQSFLDTLRWVFPIVNILSFSVCAGVIAMYYPSVARREGTWLWPFKNDLSGFHYFVIGVMAMMFYVGSRHLYNQVWRWMDEPRWMLDHVFVAFMVYWTVIIGCMHLLSRDVEKGQIPAENWRWFGVCVALGFASALFLIHWFD